MANFEIDEDQAALIRELRKLETSDPVHANVIQVPRWLWCLL